LFIMYVADLAALIEEHNLSPHQFADDTQINGSCPPSQVDDFSSTVSGCVNDVADWMRSNRLQLNPEKTELLWCTTSRRQHRLPTTTLSVGSTTVAPVSSVRDLGIFVDSDLVMRTHVCRTVSSCFAALRQLRSIRHLVSATVFSRLSLLWFYVGSTTVMAHWSASRPPLSADSSRSRTPRRDWYSVSADLTTSRMRSSASTGCECCRH